MHAHKRTSGRWSGGVGWRFVQSTDLPPDDLITACFGLVVTGRDGTLLVRHETRGWEFPGGRRQRDETVAATLRREVLEEASVALVTAQAFGYHELTATTPVLNPETGRHFPFPRSYIAFFLIDAHQTVGVPLTAETTAARVFTLAEARAALQGDSNQAVLAALGDHFRATPDKDPRCVSR